MLWYVNVFIKCRLHQKLLVFVEENLMERIPLLITLSKIMGTQKVNVYSLKDVIKDYCNNVFPDFLSLDVEGLDFEILKSIDFDK